MKAVFHFKNDFWLYEDYGAWRHFALTDNDDKQKLFVDGKEIEIVAPKDARAVHSE